MPPDFRWNAPIELFWDVRHQQTQRQVDAGLVDAGTRGSVTGGKHMDPLTQSVADLFRSDPALHVDVRYGGRVSLPGYYRRTKDWDLVVLYRSALVAAIEFKSQVGSFGNNFNNRSEEAIGNAADIWRAYEEGVFGPVRPWLGFVMLVEDAKRSTTPLGNPPALFSTDEVFRDTSYLDRYRILMQRLVRQKQYDAAVVASTRQGEGVIDEPVFDLSFANFEAAVIARPAYIKALPETAFSAD
ncbi:PaeR7I family type II restriction endonuclease [Propionimicrobium sp. PCR01-08-3]|uniref:PaeR7I family type II restriction endonuclease n=1 Tax=Propionimicrobium sp. PCR01-08-3 TaxID=3052086 RepID=UPI00255CEEEC|nr:PaeR7I family type II restriction endonuclease [Propionimicrobium sp. PCR01-08-3]WIY84019.1 PaeR7I family type II restriction endonuclease [Propionimicrobium sp. PCR01-08-3]